MTKLSVNINKIATLRNARGGNVPDVVKVALDCEDFGADGITVHPRPDERHITRKDVLNLRPVLRTEFNIEGNPSPEFIDLVLKVKPHQVTLVTHIECWMEYKRVSSLPHRGIGAVQASGHPYFGICRCRPRNGGICS